MRARCGNNISFRPLRCEQPLELRVRVPGDAADESFDDRSIFLPLREVEEPAEDMLYPQIFFCP